jgi:hypothetical protein
MRIFARVPSPPGKGAASKADGVVGARRSQARRFRALSNARVSCGSAMRQDTRRAPRDDCIMGS